MSATTAFFRNGRPFGNAGGRAGGRAGGGQNGGSAHLGGPGFGRYAQTENMSVTPMDSRGFGPSVREAYGGGGGGRPAFGAPPQGAFSSPQAVGGGRGGSTAAAPHNVFSSPAVGGRGGSVSARGVPPLLASASGRGMNSPRPAGLQQGGDARNYGSGSNGSTVLPKPTVTDTNMSLNEEWLRMEKEAEEEEARNSPKPVAVSAEKPQEHVAKAEPVGYNPSFSSNIPQSQAPGQFLAPGSHQWGGNSAAQPQPPVHQVPATTDSGSFSTGQQWGGNSATQPQPPVHQATANSGSFSTSGGPATGQQWGGIAATQPQSSINQVTAATPGSGSFSASGGPASVQQWVGNAAAQPSVVQDPSSSQVGSGGNRFSASGKGQVWNAVVEPSSPPGPADIMEPFSVQQTGQQNGSGPAQHAYGAPAGGQGQPMYSQPTHGTAVQPGIWQYNDNVKQHEAPRPPSADQYQLPASNFPPQAQTHQASSQQPAAGNFLPPASNYPQPTAGTFLPSAPSYHQQQPTNVNYEQPQYDSVPTQRNAAVPSVHQQSQQQLSEAQKTHQNRESAAHTASSTDTFSSNESPKKNGGAVTKADIAEIAAGVQQLSDMMANLNKILQKVAER